MLAPHTFSSHATLSSPGGGESGFLICELDGHQYKPRSPNTRLTAKNYASSSTSLSTFMEAPLPSPRLHHEVEAPPSSPRLQLRDHPPQDKPRSTNKRLTAKYTRPLQPSTSSTAENYASSSSPAPSPLRPGSPPPPRGLLSEYKYFFLKYI